MASQLPDSPPLAGLAATAELRGAGITGADAPGGLTASDQASRMALGGRNWLGGAERIVDAAPIAQRECQPEDSDPDQRCVSHVHPDQPRGQSGEVLRVADCPLQRDKTEH